MWNSLRSNNWSLTKSTRAHHGCTPENAPSSMHYSTHVYLRGYIFETIYLVCIHQRLKKYISYTYMDIYGDECSFLKCKLVFSPWEGIESDMIPPRSWLRGCLINLLQGTPYYWLIIKITSIHQIVNVLYDWKTLICLWWHKINSKKL